MQRGVLQDVVYDAEVPHLFDTVIYEPVTAGALRGAAVIAASAVGQPPRRTSSTCLVLLVVLLALVRIGVLT